MITAEIDSFYEIPSIDLSAISQSFNQPINNSITQPTAAFGSHIECQRGKRLRIFSLFFFFLKLKIENRKYFFLKA